MQKNLTLIIGIMCLALGVYLLISQQEIRTSTPVNNLTTPSASTVFRAKRTVPQGAMLGDATNGLYYANPTNSLETGVAYKFLKGETVYIYDGKKLRGVATSSAYFDFYGCNRNMRIIDCAPVYLMPSFVTKSMLDGEIMK